MKIIFLLAFLILRPAEGMAWNFMNPIMGSNMISFAHTIRGLELFEKGNFKKSFDHLEKAVSEAEECCSKDRTKNAVFYWNIGVFYEKNGEYMKHGKESNHREHRGDLGSAR